MEFIIIVLFWLVPFLSILWVGSTTTSPWTRLCPSVITSPLRMPRPPCAQWSPACSTVTQDPGCTPSTSSSEKNCSLTMTLRRSRTGRCVLVVEWCSNSLFPASHGWCHWWLFGVTCVCVSLCVTSGGSFYGQSPRAALVRGQHCRPLIARHCRPGTPGIAAPLLFLVP